ncbi:MAG: hypothetical protein ABIA77_02915 [Candidatus Omnitrophota bacterium]
MCVLMYGCKVDEAGLEKTVLEQDPSFREVLDRRDVVRKELNGLKTAFAREEKKINDEMSVLKDRKIKVNSEYVSKLEQIKRRIQPERNRLRIELLETENRYKKKAAEAAMVERDIKDINGLVSKKEDLSLTQEEIRTWNERLSFLIARKADVMAEKEKAKAEIDLLKSKIKIVGI